MSIPAPMPDRKPIQPAPPDTPATERQSVPTFAANIQPIFQTKCFSCHGGTSKKGGLDLRTHATLNRGGNSGSGVIPGKPSSSPVWTTIQSGQMPPRNRPQLTPAEQKLIRDWIAAGAK